MSSVDHFAFLSPVYPLLYSLLKQAERQKENDTQVFLIKLRLFGELTCHELSEVLHLQPPVRGDLKNKIAQLKLSGKLPDHLIEGLESIQGSKL